MLHQLMNDGISCSLPVEIPVKMEYLNKKERNGTEVGQGDNQLFNEIEPIDERVVHDVSAEAFRPTRISLYDTHQITSSCLPEK